MNFRRKRPELETVLFQGSEVEWVTNYKYLGVELDNKPDWSCHMKTACKKGQRRIYFLRRLQSFNICQPLLCFLQDCCSQYLVLWGTLLGSWC